MSKLQSRLLLKETLKAFIGFTMHRLTSMMETTIKELLCIWHQHLAMLERSDI